MHKWLVKKDLNNNYFLNVSKKSLSCQVGRNGIIKAKNKKEGDFFTPAGLWRLKKLYYRKNRLFFSLDGIHNKIILEEISENCAWCDDENSTLYNKKIKIIEGNAKFKSNYENLWREDHAYDLFFELGFNDAPIIKGKGSAIFLHCSFNDLRPTAGCVAVSKGSFKYILKELRPNTFLDISDN